MSTHREPRLSCPYVQRAEKVFPGGSINVLQLPPAERFVVARAQGARVWDENGREYIDLVMGSGPLILGHAHPAVREAVRAQAELGTTYYQVSKPAVELAEAILEAFPGAEKLRFTSDGSDATYMAVRLARAATGRRRVLKFEGGFHGSHDMSMISLSSKGEPAFPRGVPSSAGVSPAAVDDVLVAPFNDLAETARIARDHRDELAAIIVEPVQRDIAPEPGFLQGLRRLADEMGCLLIFDEVVTGFRFRYGGVQELFGVRADLTCLGKIIGGGLPLAAVVGPADILDLCVPGAGRLPVYLSGTLFGNPLAAAAGLATLAELRREGVYQRLAALGQRLRSGMEQVLAEAGVTGTVTGMGSMFHMHFAPGPIRNYRDTQRGDGAALRDVHLGLLRRGVYVNPGAKGYLSLAHEERDLDLVLEALAASVADVAPRLRQLAAGSGRPARGAPASCPARMPGSEP